MSQLDPQAVALIRKEVWRTVGAGILAIGLLNAVALLTWVPSQAAKLAADDPSLRKVRDEILMEAGGLAEQTKQGRAALNAAAIEITDLATKIDAIKQADPGKVGQMVAELNTLTPQSRQILDAVESLRASIPKGVRVTYKPGDHMGWGNKNSHASYCPDKYPSGVMVSGAVGTGSGDFSVACGQIELVK